MQRLSLWLALVAMAGCIIGTEGVVTTTARRVLKIGGIFDDSWAANHAKAAEAAVRRINNDSRILAGFELQFVQIDVAKVRAYGWLSLQVQSARVGDVHRNLWSCVHIMS